MTDDQSVKDLAINTIGATQLPGTARTFSRVASSSPGVFVRRSTHISSLSPTDLRIQQTPENKNGIVRHAAYLDQVLTRLDALSNPIGRDTASCGLVSVRKQSVSLAEYTAMVSTFAGWLLANNGENIGRMYNGET